MRKNYSSRRGDAGEVHHRKRGQSTAFFATAVAADLMNKKSIISGITSGSTGSDTLNPVGASTTGVLQINRTPGRDGIVIQPRSADLLAEALLSLYLQEELRRTLAVAGRARAAALGRNDSSPICDAAIASLLDSLSS